MEIKYRTQTIQHLQLYSAVCAWQISTAKAEIELHYNNVY